MGLIKISADVPLEFQTFKNERNISWAGIIREGIQNIKIKEKLMQEKYEPVYDWREKAKKILDEALTNARERE